MTKKPTGKRAATPSRKTPAKKAPPARKPPARTKAKAAKPKEPKKVKPVSHQAKAVTKKAEPAPLGRPTDFKPEYVEQARKLCLLGATDQELADFFEVTARTIYRWKATQHAFCQALKAGKSEADDRVERSLFARATGYEHDEVDIRVVNGVIVQTTIRKFYPPDTVAGIFWLKNRRKEEWRDKIDHQHSGLVELANLTDDDLDKAIQEKAARLGLNS